MQLVCSGVAHEVPLVMIALWQQFDVPPGRVPQPLPPHSPHVLGQQTFPAGDSTPDVQNGGAGGGDGGGEPGGGGGGANGGGETGGDGGKMRTYIEKPG